MDLNKIYMESYMNLDQPMSQDIGNFYFDAHLCKGLVIA